MAPDSKRMTAISILGGIIGTFIIMGGILAVASYFNVQSRINAQVLPEQQVEGSSVCSRVASIRQSDRSIVINYDRETNVTLYVKDEVISPTMVTVFYGGKCRPYTTEAKVLHLAISSSGGGCVCRDDRCHYSAAVNCDSLGLGVGRQGFR